MPFLKKQWWKDYFSFTKKERLGAIVLILVISIVFILPVFFSKPSPPDASTIKEFKDAVEQIRDSKDSFTTNYNSRRDYGSDNRHYNEPAVIESTLFYFDPNTATPQEWQRLGVKEKVIHTIANYLSKGGKFKKPEDILKIYGLPENDAQRLIPFVRIGNALPQSENKIDINNKPAYEHKIHITTIDVNNADTNALKALPGIGSKLAQRIINFRDKLGGFYAVKQIGETYGLPDSTFQKISPYLIINKENIKHININIATANELKQHPYIKWNLANAIVQYRQQHNDYQHVDDLKKLMILTEEEFEKISSYLIVK